MWCCATDWRPCVVLHNLSYRSTNQCMAGQLQLCMLPHLLYNFRLTGCWPCRLLLQNSTNVKALFMAMATAMYTWSGIVVPANVYTMTRLQNVALSTNTQQQVVGIGSALWYGSCSAGCDTT